MRLHSITTTHDRPKSRRVGRGNGSGRGTFAGRGVKGQKARSGHNIPRTFIGGSTALIQRLPKLKGFKSHAQKPTTMNLARLVAVYKAGETVSMVSMLEKGLISTREALDGVKIVGAANVKDHGLKFDTTNPKLTLTKRLQA